MGCCNSRRTHPARSPAALALAWACALVLSLTACGRSVDERLGQVRTLIERQDRAAAMVSV